MNKSSFALAVVILISPAVVSAKQNPKAEIIKRCRAQMGKYGASMVLGCVQNDVEAVMKLSKMLKDKKNKPIVIRCLGRMKKYGYSMVLGCAQNDIEAENALSRF